MILTNKHNIPVALYNVIKKNIYKPTYDYTRVTELISAPLVKELTIKHWNEITADASDFLFSILGQSVHYILEQGTPENALGEERMSWKGKDGILSGKSDLYHNEGIEDWKVTSVFSFLLGLKEEWEAQLNVYKFLWNMNHFPVKSLKINAILRDWMRGKAKFDMTYPQIPFLSYKVPLWDDKKAMEYVNTRFTIHQLGSVECTPHERWERPDSWAIKKEGNKKATRVLDTEIEAKQYIENMKDEKAKEKMIIEHRLGERIKCNDYCLPRDFCPFNQK